jgi:hypothetical protein
MLNLIEAMRNSSGELTNRKRGSDFSALYTSKAEGSVIGLAISRSIAESYGGRCGRRPRRNTSDIPFHVSDPGDGVICSWLSEALSVARSWRLV